MHFLFPIRFEESLWAVAAAAVAAAEAQGGVTRRHTGQKPPQAFCMAWTLMIWVGADGHMSLTICTLL